MKPSLLLLLLPVIGAITSCSNNKNQPASVHPDSAASSSTNPGLLCEMPDIKHLVERVDTIEKKNKLSYTVNWHDAKDRIIKQFYVRIPQTDSTKESSTTVIYDTAGRVLYQNIVDSGIQFQCYLYSYHSDGSLASKEGYGSGQSGMRTQYPKKDSTATR
jgi:hypothetical protein